MFNSQNAGRYPKGRTMNSASLEMSGTIHKVTLISIGLRILCSEQTKYPNRLLKHLCLKDTSGRGIIHCTLLQWQMDCGPVIASLRNVRQSSLLTSLLFAWNVFPRVFLGWNRSWHSGNWTENMNYEPDQAVHKATRRNCFKEAET